METRNNNDYIELPDFFCAGVSGAGKDTLADFLKSYYGYHKMRIADTIKRIICEKHNMTFDELEVEKRNNPELRTEHHTTGLWLNSHLNRIELLCKRRAMDYQYINEPETPITLVDVRGFDEVEQIYKSCNNVVGLFLTKSNTTEFKSNHWTDNGFFDINSDMNIFEQLLENPSWKIIIVDNGRLFNNEDFVELFNTKYSGKVEFELIAFNDNININGQLLVESVDDKLNELYPDIIYNIKK